VMALIVALVAGLLVAAESQASDRSSPQGFLDHYDKFITPNFNQVKHANGPDALSYQKVPADQMDGIPQAQNSLGFAFGVGLLSLVTMLGVGIRRAMQPATVLASNGALLGDNNMEMESQGAAARKVGWGQPSFQNTPPPTLCYAKAPGKQTDSLGFDPLGLNMREAEIKHGRTATLATLFNSDPELKTKGFKNARFAAAATAFAPLAAFAGGQSEGTGLSLGIDDGREGTVLTVIFGFFFLVYYNWAKDQPDSDSDFFAEYDERRL